MSDQRPVLIRPRAQEDISIGEQDNPRSVVNLVSPVVREAISRLPGEMLALSDKELESLTPKGSFTVVDRRLRTSFWMEYGRAQDTLSSMNMSAVFGGICSRPYFYSSVLQDKARLAYILSPPTDYKLAMEEALSYGVDRLREILELPIVDAVTGKADPRIADVILKTVALIDQRQKGGFVQKIHQLNQNVGQPKAQAPANDMAEIDRKLAELESKVNQNRDRISQAKEISDAEIVSE